MRITLGVTDTNWSDYLRARPDLDEVNFWVPSGQRFTGRASLDEPFLFKSKSPHNTLVGGGYYSGFYERRVTEAWAIFGQANGVDTEAELHATIQTYRSRNNKPFQSDPTIGCIVIHNVFFVDRGHELPQPEHWGHSIVQGKTYDASDIDWAYLERAQAMMSTQARVDLTWTPDLLHLELDEARYGIPTLMRRRLGQRGFRWSIEDAYGERCAITGSDILPALQAAHIRPYAAGGAHSVDNGILLRADVHALFDNGYIGISPDYRLRVSPRLKSETGNGIALYKMEERGDLIRLPDRADHHPQREYLTWHMDEVFKRSA